MGFKASTKEAPKATRNRQRDPNMVKVGDQLFKGEIKSVECSGDEKLSLVPVKGEKQSPREKSARAEASKLAHYVQSTYAKNGEKLVRTVWDAPNSVVVVAKVNGDTPK